MDIATPFKPTLRLLPDHWLGYLLRVTRQQQQGRNLKIPFDIVIQPLGREDVGFFMKPPIENPNS
jgi:hypothetical protein